MASIIALRLHVVIEQCGAWRTRLRAQTLIARQGEPHFYLGCSCSASGSLKNTGWLQTRMLRNLLLLTKRRIIAARNKRLDVANLLLSFGADVNFANAVGDTPLHWAAFHGVADMVSYLLSKGAAINAQGEYGNTPLHLACAEGHVDVVSILLQEGASVIIKNKFGNKALHLSLNPEINRMDIEEARRVQEEKDRQKMENILAEERRIEEEELAKALAEAEENKRLEEERIALEKAEAERLKKERRAKKKANKGKKGKK